MIYGELGRFPLKYKIYSTIINYWKRNIESNEQKLSVITYKLLFSMYENHIFISRWIINVKHILDFAGFGYIWLRQFDSNINRKWLSQKIKQCYCDMHIQEWNNFLETSPNAIIYRLFKTEHIYEPYLNILSLKNRKIFTRFRLCNHRLPIETGRWLNIPRGERICINLCVIKDVLGMNFITYFNVLYVLNDLRKR